MNIKILFVVFIIILTITAICVVLFVRLFNMKKRLHDIVEVLDDISSGNGNRRILARPGDVTASICYKINKIVCDYEDRLSCLRKAVDTNKQVMTSLSHDVRTPLTTLIGYLDAVHKDIVKGKEREGYIETARKKAYDMKNYIDMLFEWFKLNSNEHTLSIQTCEMAELTRNLLKDWIPIFEEKQLDYDINIPECPIIVKVDLDGYSRILNNLIQNVITHSNASRVEISLSNKSNQVELCVVDNGTGIPREDLDHIFERLYKCDKGRSQKGSGLGLNIVQQLVKKMNGEISVNSKPNKYTSFVVSFPLAD